MTSRQYATFEVDNQLFGIDVAKVMRNSTPKANEIRLVGLTQDSLFSDLKGANRR